MEAVPDKRSHQRLAAMRALTLGFRGRRSPNSSSEASGWCGCG
jgi:hypothetical protein